MSAKGMGANKNKESQETGQVSETPTVSPKSAFDPEVFGPVVIIQQARLYDVMMMLLGSVNPAAADQLERMHARGEFMAPPPAYSALNDTDSE